MCVAIFHRAGTRIPEVNLEAGFRHNPHGAGFAYVDAETSKVRIEKGFMTYNDLVKAYYPAVEKYGETSPFLLHMRIRTSGDVSEKNTHPFKVKNGAMIHNGSFFHPSGRYAGVEGDLKSDTRVFAEHLHNVLTYEDVLAAQRTLLRAVGTYNKLCFLYDGGRHLILNEDGGHWVDDIWYSNRSCHVGV